MKKVCFLLSLTAVLAGCAAKAPVTGNAPKKPAFIRVVNLSSVPLTGLTDRQPFSSTEPGAAIAMRRIPSGDRKLVVTPAGAQSMEESINLQEGEVYSVVVTGEKKSSKKLTIFGEPRTSSMNGPMIRLANFSSQAVTVSISNTAEPEQKLAPQQSSGTLAIAPGSCTITVKRNGRTLASETQSVEADGGYSAYYWEPRQGQGKVLILHNNEKMKMRGTGSSAM